MRELGDGPWELIGFNTEDGEDVRHREYTTSRKKAELFERIPKIQFTDSGHGIVFRAVKASKHGRAPKPRVYMPYVAEQIALMKSDFLVRRYVEKLRDVHDFTVRSLQVQLEEEKRAHGWTKSVLDEKRRMEVTS